MTDEQKDMLNGFFITVFNSILAWEDQSLRDVGRQDLTVREMHVIEAVSILEVKGANTMANVAKVLSVSPGSLTTSVNALVSKGYLSRQRSEKDRRKVLVSPTEKGKEVNVCHKQFHDEMVGFVSELFSEDETELIFKVLERLSKFFAAKAAVKR